ncbi:SGNH/GDSL hydrolase family protein [Paenarthrobacter sp. NPDC089322]|uniref:SGNH/GDSL hydrolase family protein n=1 Tax=Paenarthrobacter sp. NPDC089322 TaxID=3155065 RepID=UPI00341EFAA5
MKKLVCYGHSWVAGDGASFPGASLAAIVSRRWGLALDNRAVGGSSSTETVSLLQSAPPPVASAYILMTGLNDLRLGGDSSSSFGLYSGALDTILTALGTTAPLARVFVVAQPHLLDFSRHAPHNRGSNLLIDTYNEELRRVVARYGNARVVEAMGWQPSSMLATDTVHPNDSGHACIADAVVHAAPTAFR